MENIFKINEKYQIASDPYNYILQETGVVEDKNSKNFGEPFARNVGYFPNLRGLMNHLAQKAVKENLGDLKAAEQRIEELKEIAKQLTF